MSYAEKWLEIQNIYLGALPERVDIRDYKLTYPITATEFPAEFEIKPCAVKNQGSVGSCVAHAIAETIEYHNKVQIYLDASYKPFVYIFHRSRVHDALNLI